MTGTVDWLDEVIMAVVGGGTAVLVSRHFARAQATTSEAHNRGLRVEIPVQLRASHDPFPKRWTRGTLAIGMGPTVWKPVLGFTLKRTPIQLPDALLVIEVRDPTTREWLRMNPSSRIIVTRRGERTLEVAAMDGDLTVAMDGVNNRRSV